MVYVDFWDEAETTANFTYSPKNPTTADNITFNASSSYDPDGNIASYEWGFGDGNTSSGDTVITICEELQNIHRR